MRDDDFDRMLSSEEDIVPSSGFAGSVMDAVRAEAATPAPIPFPWKWAMPGLAAEALVLVSLLIAVFGHSGPGPVVSSGAALSPALAAVVEGAKNIAAHWIALALLLSVASLRFSMRLVGAGR
jgi:hypothetical protein